MGYRDFPCALASAETQRQHDQLHESPVFTKAQAVEDIADVFVWSQSHAFGHSREALIESFRSLFVDASDKHIERLILAHLQPERYGVLAEINSEWVREHARKIADGEVRV